MIQGGNATVFVSDMDRAVHFYTEVLGLELRTRYEDAWAEAVAGDLVIGLHGQSERAPDPGTAGAIQIGLLVDGPIEGVVEALGAKGVSFRGPVVDDGAVKLAYFSDPDGNSLYLCEVKTAWT